MAKQTSKSKNLGGRPRKIKSPREFDKKVDEFVSHCKENKEPITWTGIALHLGFTSRHALDEYQDYDGFSASVKRAKSIVENAYEKNLHGPAAAGSIFALKNMQWTDRQEITGAGGAPIELVISEKDSKL